MLRPLSQSINTIFSLRSSSSTTLSSTCSTSKSNSLPTSKCSSSRRLNQLIYVPLSLSCCEPSWDSLIVSLASFMGTSTMTIKLDLSNLTWSLRKSELTICSTFNLHLSVRLTSRYSGKNHKTKQFIRPQFPSKKAGTLFFIFRTFPSIIHVYEKILHAKLV